MLPAWIASGNAANRPSDTDCAPATRRSAPTLSSHNNQQKQIQAERIQHPPRYHRKLNRMQPCKPNPDRLAKMPKGRVIFKQTSAPGISRQFSVTDGDADRRSFVRAQEMKVDGGLAAIEEKN